MTEEVDAEEFYERTIKGTDNFRSITLERGDGAKTSGFEMHVVDKETLAVAIQAMPDSIFEAVEDEDEDLSAEEAEEMAREAGASAQISPELVEGFELLCKESLEHEDLAPTKMEYIIEDFSFEMLFEIGSEILNYSLEEGGDVRGFHEQT